MYKIKIKIKYIAMVVLILIGLFFARDLIIGEIMYTMGQRYLDDNEELAISYLRKYIQRYPEQDNALEAMDIILQNKVHSSPQVTLSYAGQGGYRYTLENRNKLDLLNKDYEKMLEYHSMNDLQQLQEMMAEFNYQAGNIEKAVEYYQEYLGENIEYLADKERMIFSLATLYLRIGHLDSALSLYNDYISENKILLLPYSKALLGWMYLINGDQEKTDLYIEEINDINMYSTYFNFSYWNPIRIENKIENIYQNKFSEEESSLEGYIKRNGRPMANVLVCLGEDRDMGTLWEADYIAITDENGFYQFKGIPADRYKFVLNLSSLRIKNMVYQGKNRNIEIGEDTKIANVNLVPEVEILSPDKPVYMDTLEPLKVTWEPYPDAAYYKFFGGVVRDNGSWSTGIEGKIYDNTAYLEFPDHIVNSNNISIDQEGIAPASLLGYEQLPTTFFYGVEAFDKEDKLISRSVNSIINNRIEYPGKELSEADKLLADRKYDEAIEEYEKHLENNPEDLRVLRILNRIYSDGYNFEEEGRNIEKAYQYSKKTYQITGDISYLWQTISSTLKLKKLEETEELLNMYIADSSDIGGHVFLVKGKLSIYQGRISEAEEYLLKAVKDGSGIGLLTVLYLLEGENEKAAGVEDLVDDKDSIHYYYREWIDDTLQKIESDQLKQFYKKIKQNQIDEAEDFLPENESGIFYRTLLKVLNPDFEENAADMLLDGYKDLETREFKEIIKELGAETIRGLKFPVEFIDW